MAACIWRLFSRNCAHCADKILNRSSFVEQPDHPTMLHACTLNDGAEAGTLR